MRFDCREANNVNNNLAFLVREYVVRWLKYYCIPTADLDYGEDISSMYHRVHDEVVPWLVSVHGLCIYTEVVLLMYGFTIRVTILTQRLNTSMNTHIIHAHKQIIHS